MGRKIIQLITGVIFICLFAQVNIEVPFNEAKIPITGQSFAVLLVAYFLKYKWGPLAIFCYLLLGAIGLPVFAKGAAGIDVFFKGSGGFLYGFLIASFFVGLLGELGWNRSFLYSLLAMFIGTAIIILCGLLQLTVMYGWSKALAYGFYPFIPGAIVKIFLGAVVPYLHFIMRPFYTSKINL